MIFFINNDSVYTYVKIFGTTAFLFSYSHALKVINKVNKDLLYLFHMVVILKKMPPATLWVTITSVDVLCSITDMISCYSFSYHQQATFSSSYQSKLRYSHYLCSVNIVLTAII